MWAVVPGERETVNTVLKLPPPVIAALQFQRLRINCWASMSDAPAADEPAPLLAGAASVPQLQALQPQLQPKQAAQQSPQPQLGIGSMRKKRWRDNKKREKLEVQQAAAKAACVAAQPTAALLKEQPALDAPAMPSPAPSSLEATAAKAVAQVAQATDQFAATSRALQTERAHRHAEQRRTASLLLERIELQRQLAIARHAPPQLAMKPSGYHLVMMPSGVVIVAPQQMDAIAAVRAFVCGMRATTAADGREAKVRHQSQTRPLNP